MLITNLELLMVTSQLNLERKALSRIYNSVALPHILYLTLSWGIFTESDRRMLRKCYFKYAKFLLQAPHWFKNRCIVKVLVRWNRFRPGLTVSEIEQPIPFSPVEGRNILDLVLLVICGYLYDMFFLFSFLLLYSIVFLFFVYRWVIKNIH